MEDETPVVLVEHGYKKQRRSVFCFFLIAFFAVFFDGEAYGQTTIVDWEGLQAISSNLAGHYIITADIDASSFTTIQGDFTGILEADAKDDGTFYTIEGLTEPLFNKIDGGYITNGTDFASSQSIVRNIILKDVNISGHVGATGAIANTVIGNVAIYNCGILSGSVGGTGNTGGLVGELLYYSYSQQDPKYSLARVLNCFSYANIVSAGTYAAGIVGNNSCASTAQNHPNVNSILRTAVVNCMFYGDILGGTNRSPVYGNQKIGNTGANGINNYDYFLETVTFDNAYGNINKYNNSWPAEERFLTRFEYYRSILNSNRVLCTWYVTNKQTANQTEADRALIAKWVLDESIAPYPILKKWGKYPSVINHCADSVWNPDANAGLGVWVKRVNAQPYEGRLITEMGDAEHPGYLKVTVNAGSNNSSATEKTLYLPITDMDTLHHDYCYAKVQLPYYNEQFGNPNGTTHNEKYGNNYTDKVVTGWKVTSVTGGTQGSFESDWEHGYNFADRYCTDKDLYSVSNRVFAQGGYYYVPEGVTDITIEAYWGNAIYLQNGGNYLDRVDLAGNAFSPAGTMPTTFNGQTVYNSIATAISKLQNGVPTYNVYDQAVVLVSNYQFKNSSNQSNLGLSSNTNLAANLRPFTWTCVDLDFDNEPDYCLELQYGAGTTRVNIHPVRFDFIPIPDLGLATKKSSMPYGCGIFIPRGHFEITETAFMHTNQFEYDGHRAYPKETAPLILNGGQYEQIVTTVETYGDISNHTNYIIIGGHVWMKKFTPGSHGDTKSKKTRLCAVSVLGAEFQEFYLTGMFRSDISDNLGHPHCYTNGGKFGLMAGSGMERVNGNVTFNIDHALIDEFYGGGINSAMPVQGSIFVTIDNSIVDYYCGGPKTGNMKVNTEVKTDATGTTFGKFFGGGNGGTNLTRSWLWDNTIKPVGYNSNPYHQANLTTEDWDKYGKFNEVDPYVPDTVPFNPFTFVSADKGYHAEFEFELMNNSGGDNDNVVARTYRWSAQFSMTTVQKVTSTLKDCYVKKEFYGGGNLSPVNGNVLSTLDNTRVDGSAFGAGFSATIPSFSVHDKSTVIYPSRDIAGVCHQGSLDYQKDGDVVRLYTWIDDAGLLKLGVTGINTSNPYFYSEAMGKWYCYTSVELSNLGTVLGNSTIIVKGHSVIQGNVFGGGDESAVLGNTVVKLHDSTHVYGNVFGGGNKGAVDGDSSVTIEDDPQNP